MKNLVIYAVVPLLLFCASCSNSPSPATTESLNYKNTNEYLVFGSYYGECIGDKCVQIFKIEKGRLFADDYHRYPGRTSSYNGDFHELEAQKYEKVKSLVQSVPTALVQESNTVLGMPDAYDQGGVYIELQHNGEHKFWMIDNDEKNIPAYLHELVRDIHKAIEELQ